MRQLINNTVYVLDFDGVVCDSTNECLVTSWNAWQKFTGKSSKKLDQEQFSKQEIIDFYKLRPYVKGAGEYLILYQAKKENIIIRNNKKFDELSLIWKNEIKEYKKIFYLERNFLRDENLDNWINLHIIYDSVITFIKEKQKSKQIYIATLKDGKSVKEILAKQKIFLENGLLLDESNISSKLDALNKITTRTNVPKRNVFFIDDNLNHLIGPHNSGYNVFLAAWSNTPSEFIRKAKNYNISILNNPEEIKNFNK